MIDRMLRAARLDVHLYEEVEADASATKQAVLIVVLVSIASGVGALGGGVASLFGNILLSLAAWVIWAWITYFVGTRILATSSTHATWGQLARALGFAQTPGLLLVFAFIGGVGPLIALVVLIWQFVAYVVAIRQALDYDSTGRAVAVILIGFIPYFIIKFILGLILLGGDAANGAQAAFLP